MAIEQVFLNWDTPGLAAAVDWLVGRFGSGRAIDLGNVVVAVPGARAGRRLLEMLVERTERAGLVLCPPQIVTVGALPELLYEARQPFADDLVQQLTWIEALRHFNPGRLAHVVAAAPRDDDLMAWIALGEMLARLHRELAADALDFRQVADCGARIEQFREDRRWQTLADVQQAYLDTLDRLGLWDRQTARLYAIRQGECHTDRRIVLLGTVDLNGSQRLMLDQVADRTTALIVANEDLAERFDEHGCLKPEAWRYVPIELSDERIEVADTPADQAEAVVRAIASFAGRYGGEQITIGVPDERLVPHIEQRLQQHAVPVRYGVGRPLSQSGPCRLLEAVADYLEHGSFAALAALVRHPDVERWLARKEIAAAGLRELDEYHGEHLPYRLGDRWLGRAESYRKVKRVHAAINDLLAQLAGDAQPLRQWGPSAAQLLVDVFGGSALDRTNSADNAVLTACEKVRDVLQSHASVPEQLMPVLTGADAMRLLLRQLQRDTIAAPANRGAVELLGWLELPLDDAAALIVTGFCEGAVPSSLNADLFLPDQLRRALGIEDNDRRYGRDAYALSVLAASREQLHLIAGRSGPQRDPLAPSRLLFACDEETVARRAKRFFSEKEEPRPVDSGAGYPNRGVSSFEVPRPQPLAEPVDSMSVTEFKSYLACPYRYYLRHRLRLAALDDSAGELDGASFGTLAHEVLGRFGAGESAASTDADEIGQLLGRTLDQVVAAWYGDSPLSAVRVQVEQLRRRLEAFARWQAGWAREGWRIEYVERGPEEGEAALIVDDRPMVLRGRIDRIDVNGSTGRRIIFDYKTFDTAKTPDQTHRIRGEWTDLQLPLYRHLARGLGIEGPIELAYIAIPKDVTKIGPLVAEWTDQELREADLTAEAVIRRVRRETFWPPADPPPPFSEQFAAICQDDQFGAAVAVADEQGGNDT